VTILGGQKVPAGRLNKLQPTPYQAVATGTVVGPQTAVDMPGLSITFDTVSDNATYQAVLVMDVDLTASTTGLASGRIMVDGSGATQFAVFSGQVSTDRGTVAQTYQGTLGTAGEHTIKAAVTAMTGQTINQYSSLMLTIYEVV
jgi:hypothetical protein